MRLQFLLIISIMSFFRTKLWSFKHHPNKKVEHTQTIQTNFLRVFDHFVGLARKGLTEQFNLCTIFLFARAFDDFNAVYYILGRHFESTRSEKINLTSYSKSIGIHKCFSYKSHPLLRYTANLRNTI